MLSWHPRYVVLYRDSIEWHNSPTCTATPPERAAAKGSLPLNEHTALRRVTNEAIRITGSDDGSTFHRPLLLRTQTAEQCGVLYNNFSAALTSYQHWRIGSTSGTWETAKKRAAESPSTSSLHTGGLSVGAHVRRKGPLSTHVEEESERQSGA